MAGWLRAGSRDQLAGRRRGAAPPAAPGGLAGRGHSFSC